MRYRKADLIRAAINNEVDVIVHGCNAFNTMNKGIAKTIKETFPGAYQVDLTTEKGSRNKLGSITVAHDNGVIIVNAYTQYTYWDRKDMLSYAAIEQCFKRVKQYYGHLRIGIPKIGAGLARGDWNHIESIIAGVMDDDVDITVYSL